MFSPKKERKSIINDFNDFSKCTYYLLNKLITMINNNYYDDMSMYTVYYNNIVIPQYPQYTNNVIYTNLPIIY